MWPYILLFYITLDTSSIITNDVFYICKICYPDTENMPGFSFFPYCKSYCVFKGFYVKGDYLHRRLCASYMLNPMF